MQDRAEGAKVVADW